MIVMQFHALHVAIIFILKERCYEFWPDKKTGMADYKLIKVNYNDKCPMKDCDKILLDVFSSARVGLKH